MCALALFFAFHLCYHSHRDATPMFVCVADNHNLVLIVCFPLFSPLRDHALHWEGKHMANSRRAPQNVWSLFLLARSLAKSHFSCHFDKISTIVGRGQSRAISQRQSNRNLRNNSISGLNGSWQVAALLIVGVPAAKRRRLRLQ